MNDPQPLPTDAEREARMFHEAYERLAPSFGYETRSGTREFDPASPNGKLMVAVCGELQSSRTPTPVGVEPVAWIEKAMELAVDFAVDSLRVGSYERKDICERLGRANYQTILLREKREASRERLRRHLYTAPPVLAMGRVPLSEQTIDAMWRDHWDGFVSFAEAEVIVRATEESHGIKQGGQHGTDN